MKKIKPYILTRIYKMVAIQSVIMIVLTTVILYESNSNGNRIIKIVTQMAIIEIIAFIIMFYYIVVKPLREINKVFQAFAEGYTVQDIFYLQYGLNAQHEAMLNRLNVILDSKQMLQASKKQAEYMALQNQINPHFLYNTLEGIRSEALIGGMDSVADMAEALAKFFRYTISKINTLVTVEDELDNVKTYCLIQQFRFGDKIKLLIEYEDGDEQEIQNIKMPKLILQPIVENAIRHGIEPLMEAGTVRIHFQRIGSRLVIYISDNGVGMEQEKLNELNEHLKGPQLNEEEQEVKNEGIAMVNVNTRIKLIFGDSYGIHFYSTLNLGTDVEITLPLEMNGEEDEKRNTAH